MCMQIPITIVKMKTLIQYAWNGVHVSAFLAKSQVMECHFSTDQTLTWKDQVLFSLWLCSLFLESVSLHVWILSPNLNIQLLQVQNMQTRVPAVDNGCLLKFKISILEKHAHFYVLTQNQYISSDVFPSSICKISIDQQLPQSRQQTFQNHLGPEQWATCRSLTNTSAHIA